MEEERSGPPVMDEEVNGGGGEVDDVEFDEASLSEVDDDGDGDSDDGNDDSDDGEGNGSLSDDDYSVLASKPLFKAIREHEPLSVIQSIVERRPKLDLARRTKLGEFPLHHAVRYGLSLAHVEYLYDLFPDAIKDTKLSRCDRLPLHLITDKTPIETVKFLVDKYSEALLLEDDNGKLPIHHAIEECSMDVLQMLVERCPESILKPDGGGYFPIHLAVRNTQLDKVRYLAQQCPVSLRQRTKPARYTWRKVDVAYDDGYLPIHLAATRRGKGTQRLEVIQFLADAHPQSLGMSAGGGNLPLHEALISDVMPDVIQLLVGMVPESIPEETRLSLLHFVIRYAVDSEAANQRERSRREGLFCRNLEHLHNNVAALVEALPASLRAKDSDGSLPIHVAVDIATRTRYGASTMLAKRLVELDPSSLLLPNDDGDLPLHIDIIRNDRRYVPPLADFLLERCPDAARVKRRNKNLAIHDAIERQMFGVARTIVQYAPDTARNQGAAGRSPLHVAVGLPLWSYRPRDNSRDNTVLGIVDVLIASSPGSLLVPDENGDLPLHVAILSPSESGTKVELVRTLLDHCPQSVREAGAGGNLSLHLAVSESSPSLPLIRLLVERGLESLEVRDAEGNVPLVLAAANKTASLDIIYWVARAKPDLFALHREGRGQKRCRGSLPGGAIDVEVEESEAQRSTAYAFAVREDGAGPPPGEPAPNPEACTDVRPRASGRRSRLREGQGHDRSDAPGRSERHRGQDSVVGGPPQPGLDPH